MFFVFFSTGLLLLLPLTTTMMTMQTASAQQRPDRVFESKEGGFRLQIPQGWVIQERDNS
jgi:hypothetical protein